MKVSVIVPVYNVRPYIKEAIDSVINQTYKDLEIILVDDGATDGSGEICDSYAMKDNRIIVIHQENKGLSAARNAGLDAMTGELVAFLDSDDAFSATMLEEMVEAMYTSSADIVECKYATYNNLTKMDEKRLAIMKSNSSTGEGLYTWQEAAKLRVNEDIDGRVWNKLYKKYIWEDLRFPCGLNYEDLYVSMDVITKAESIYVINKNLVMYRSRFDSIMHSDTYKNKRDYMTSLNHYIDHIKKLTPEIFSESDVGKILNGRYISLISSYCTYRSRNTKENKRFMLFLKNEIEKSRREINVGDFSYKMRFKHVVYQFSPTLLVAINRVYMALKRIKQKLVEVIMPYNDK